MNIRRSISSDWRRLALLVSAAVALLLPAMPVSSASASSTSFVTEFPVPSEDGWPFGITNGPDGNIWFTLVGKFGRITPEGQLSTYTAPEATAVNQITTGPDGNLWFTQWGVVGRASPAGVVTKFALPDDESGADGAVSGPGGVWFTETKANAIGLISPSGEIKTFPLPAMESDPSEIALGPDGNLWFTEKIGRRIGRITPGGQITEFPVSGEPAGIVSGPEGDLWFTGDGTIGKITTSGQVTEFPLPLSREHLLPANPENIAVGPDGDLWFNEPQRYVVGRMTPSGQVTEFPLSLERNPMALTPGPDNSVWFSIWDGSFEGPDPEPRPEIGAIGRISTGIPGVQITKASATVHRGDASYELACSGSNTQGCHGNLQLQLGGRRKARKPAFAVGHSGYTVPPEGVRRVSVPLTRTALHKLRHRGLTIVVTAFVKGGQGSHLVASLQASP